MRNNMRLSFGICSYFLFKSCSQVVLGRKKATGDVYAIKVLKKNNLNNKNQMDHISNERNILAITDNPFVVKLYYSFQSVNNLYMVLEYMPGGDCFSLLRNLVAFPEHMTRQYIAETVLALEYLHKNGIVHRDLKVIPPQPKRQFCLQAI